MKVKARFEDIKEIKGLFDKDLAVVGVGVTAFQRSGLGMILPNYRVLCLLKTGDLEAIGKKMKVVSLVDDLEGVLPEKYNTSSILKDENVREFLQGSEPYKGVFVYKSSLKIDRLVKNLGLKLLSTPGYIRKDLENKKQFRLELVRAGIEPIEGESLLVDDLDEERWDRFKQDLGERLVFQLTDYTIGGGLGTFFVESREDFEAFKEFVKRRREGREIKWVNVTRFIFGKQASISGCATKFGTVCGQLQTQVMDQPELAGLVGRSGVWLGHSWQKEFSKIEQIEAEKICKKWGEYIYKKGYKGIFGLDVMVDDKDRVYPVECNARYTGSFPVYTMMQLREKVAPMEVWHVLEWLGVDYEMDIDEVQGVYRKPLDGAHLVMHNLERKYVTPTRTVRAGVYRKVSNLVEWVRPGFSLLDIKSDNELVVTDRVLGENHVFKPAERINRLLFNKPVLDEKGRLLKEVQEIVKAVYKMYELMPVERPM